MEKDKNKLIALIPARKGSKGISGKNVRLLNGKPLIAYSIESALKSKYIDTVVVSTDDPKAEKIARAYGVKVIKRPKKLAEDSSSMFDVLDHALESLKKYEFNSIILLQPTSPLRTVVHLDEAIELFLNNDCKNVVSACKTKKSPYWSFEIKQKYLKPLFNWDCFMTKRRQDLSETYNLNGAIYIATIKNFYKQAGFLNKETLVYVMPYELSIDIDEETDFRFSDFLLKEGNK